MKLLHLQCAAVLVMVLTACQTTTNVGWEVRHLVDPAISTGRWESHPAIDPTNGDLWFVRSNPDFSGWAIYRSPCTNGRWGTALAEVVLVCSIWTAEGGEPHRKHLDDFML